MKTKNILSVLAITTLVASTAVFAQDANVSAQANVNMGGQGRGQPPQGMNRPPHGEGGFFQNMFGGMRGERKEVRQEFRDEKHELQQNFRDDMNERREWMMGSTTPGMATPTPWKNYKEGMGKMREDMRGKMASLTEAQMASITAKLGITVDQLKAQLASGTPLRQIIGDKIPREDMMKIMPMPMMGSTTMMGTGTFATNTRPFMRGDRPGQGFFNSIRQSLFGQDNREENNYGEVNGNAEINANPGIGNFFRRLFGF